MKIKSKPPIPGGVGGYVCINYTNMKVLLSENEIKKLFLETEITMTEIESKKLETEYRIRLIELNRARFDRRNQEVLKNKKWELEGEELCWRPFLSCINMTHRWDITTDATFLCYRKEFVEYIYFKIELLSLNKIDEVITTKFLDDEDRRKRHEIRDTLTPVLIEQMYPFGKLFTGELETRYAVHLKEIHRGMHLNMPYKPGYGIHEWVRNKSLNWGSCTGWDITLDGKIACCRVGYDDYVNFEIELLSDQEMLDKSLITENEFQSKKAEIIGLV